MRKHVIFLSMIVVAILMGGCNGVNRQKREAILNAHEKKEYGPCLKLIEKTYTQKQLMRDTTVSLVKAECLYREGRYNEAAKLFEQCKQADYLEDRLYYIFQAKINKNQRDFNAALLFYDSAIASKADNSSLYYERAIVYGALENYDKAIKDCFTSMALDTANNSAAYTNLGSIYSDWGKYDSALVYLNKALEYDSSAATFENIAVSYFHMNKPELALANFTQAIRLDSNDPFLYIMRGNFYQQTENMDKACSDWKEALILRGEATNEVYEKYCK